MRIDKFLSNAGIATRSEVKIILKNKKVTVNDAIVTHGKTQIDELKDVIKVNDEIISYRQFRYFVLNKPKGYVSANIDNLHPTIMDFFKDLKVKDLTHVGRLDLDTTGVILITNDGKLGHTLISPKYNINKTYHFKINNKFNSNDVAKIRNGIKLENGELCRSANLEIITKNEGILNLQEGKYHQVKRMMRALGHEVIELDRTSFAGLTYRNLKLGDYYELTDEEIEKLKSLVNL